VDLETGDREVEEASAIPFDSDGLVVEQVWYTSADGTRAPMYVTHREGIELDGSHPTILNGYGGFNSSIKPGFSTTAAVWLEMGGVYAVATLRGGSEFGEQWHQGGMLTNKENVFDDFIGAAEYLIEAGFTSADRLGISGGSNGGLLVASAMTKRPDLFRAVLCTYPDLDMVRFYTFTETNNMPALLEYGDASNPEHFEAIRQYSPYQAVRDGVEYPAVMLATGDLDTRVPPLQARRMTARLQAASSSGLPVILWYDDMGGHAAGRGRPMSLRVEDSARQITFLAQQLGLGGEEGA
jgi:prolyl oligopeptidase